VGLGGCANIVEDTEGLEICLDYLGRHSGLLLVYYRVIQNWGLFINLEVSTESSPFLSYVYHEPSLVSQETVSSSAECSWDKKVKYVDLYSTLSRSASNALPLPVSALVSESQPYSQASANTVRPRDTG